MLAGIEIVAHLPGEQQAAIELIGPLVVGADELRRCALFGGANARAAMAAGIVESSDLSLAVAYDDDRIVANLNREVVARLGHLAIMADEQPVAIENVLHVETVIIRIGIKGLFKSVARFPVPEIPEQFVTNIHVVSSPL